MAEPSCTVTSLPIDGTSWGTSPSQGAGEWLPRKTMRRRLAAVHRQWNPIRGYDTSSLGLIQFEVWSAQVGLVPYPEVCVHTRQGVVIGVLQGESHGLGAVSSSTTLPSTRTSSTMRASVNN
ncbi:hypothetical protein [Alicyclobacillus fastidiosus]|uniref:hypothetical protein n=1 Tax=Alicyclobacillus fastidiosus TaxID=392011 RepID=UPI0024E1298A|nr:hypothetical protein [Alicyclobacillus fastidiosus]